MTLQARKYKLIQKITDSDSEELINQLEQLMDEKSDFELTDDTLSNFTVSIDEKLDIDQLIKEQGFKNATKEELDAIIEKANLTEMI